MTAFEDGPAMAGDSGGESLLSSSIGEPQLESREDMFAAQQGVHWKADPDCESYESDGRKAVRARNPLASLEFTQCDHSGRFDCGEMKKAAFVDLCKALTTMSWALKR